MSTEPLVVQALFAFKGSNNDELCFKKGDLITVTQKDEGWWEGTLNEKTGWFPSNYVKETTDVPKVVIPQENRYQSVVLRDLIDSERAHVTELEGLVTNFLQPLEKSSILTADEYKQLTGNICEILETHQQLLKLIEEEESKPGLEQRVGKLFITWAPKMKKVHQTYCSSHPRAVCILDKYKDELTKYMESRGAASPGVLVLTTLLSKPFRRLDKYSGMLHELERHVEECHPDRGDTQRSVAVYKEIAATCSATRRQKELELQVLTGPVRGWEGPSLTTLGDIIYMGSVAVGPQHHDRYFVLFPSTLLILSVSHRLSAFIYEGKLPLSGLVINRLEDSDQYKNAFEISAPMIEKKIAVCQSQKEADHWVELLRRSLPKNSNNVNQKISPSQAQFVPQPPPHLNPRGYSTRTSVLNFKNTYDYIPTYPPENYPPCAPFASLTKYFSRCIKDRVITSKLLKQLLYPEYLNKMNLSLVKIRHHKTECVIMTKATQHFRDSVINCDSDDDEDSSDDNDDARVKRQNAVVKSSSSSDNDDSSSSSNPFGYIRYYNPKSGKSTQVETKYESFIDYGVVQLNEEPKKKSVVLISTAKLEMHKQGSQNSEASSCLTPKPFGACEDLANLDDDNNTLHVPMKQQYMPLERQSCPTKLVGNKFNASSLTAIYIPSWSNSDSNISCQAKFDISENSSTHSSSIEVPINTLILPDQISNKIVAECLYSDSDIIKPPSMFNNNNVENKPRRRSSIQINPQDLKSARRRCVSSRFLRMSPMRQSCCCCVECSISPRSSDSGMAGSCTLNSPDLANVAQERCSVDMTNLIGNHRAGITLSEIEARDFESQCPCTSPFGSTPRTSCQPCVSSHGNSLHTSVTSSLDLCPQPWPNNKGHEIISCDDDNGLVKSRSVGCLLDNDENQRQSEGAVNDNDKDDDKDQPVFKSGLYAHWWLKAKIPYGVLKGIYQDTRDDATANTTDVTSGGSQQRSGPRPPLDD